MITIRLGESSKLCIANTLTGQALVDAGAGTVAEVLNEIDHALDRRSGYEKSNLSYDDFAAKVANSLECEGIELILAIYSAIKPVGNKAHREEVAALNAQINQLNTQINSMAESLAAASDAWKREAEARECCAKLQKMLADQNARVRELSAVSGEEIADAVNSFVDAWEYSDGSVPETANGLAKLVLAKRDEDRGRDE